MRWPSSDPTLDKYEMVGLKTAKPWLPIKCINCKDMLWREQVRYVTAFVTLKRIYCCYVCGFSQDEAMRVFIRTMEINSITIRGRDNLWLYMKNHKTVSTASNHLVFEF